MSTGIAARWREIAVDCALLWSEANELETIDAKLWREFEGVVRRRKQIDESQFKINDERLELAQTQVLKSRGLSR